MSSKNNPRPEFARQVEGFLSIPGSCAHEVEGYHYVFISNRDEVLDLMSRFLAAGEC